LRIVIPSEVEESLIVSQPMMRRKPAESLKAGNQKKAQSAERHSIKRMRGFLRGISATVRRDKDRV